MFYFYALPSEPFLVLAVAMALGMIMGGPRARPERRIGGTLVAGGFVALVALCFVYFYPIYVGETITYSQWYARMWLGNKWI
jgi:dolichyl-phosphate-mannose--protein O-mannosyl transferase